MRYIRGCSNDPYFNLASEQYYFDTKEEIFMLWINAPAVIIGRNQNAVAEIDHDYVKENNITVARRISGGGAVFHDLGNVNFTFLVNDSKFGDYSSFTKNLLAFLNENGCGAKLEGRNDLTVDGMKFSGMAQKIGKDRMMHHGCILFDANLDKLSGALRPDPEKIKSKGVQSVRKRVTNLSEYLNMDTSEFFDRLEKWMIKAENLDVRPMTEEERCGIQKLRDEKFSTDEWIYGISPEYTFHKKARFNGGIFEVYLKVEHAIIKDCKIYGDFFSAFDVEEAQNALIGSLHLEDNVRTALNKIGADKMIQGITLDEIMTVMF
ncbi:MAG: lipoate--protein ligase [Bacillota bacterium]|nr:lipoate--protein ligase [Bacillota bacterium]